MYYYRYSQATALLDNVVYLYGGASSTEDGATVYHHDFFALNCKLCFCRAITSNYTSFCSLVARSPLEWLPLAVKGTIPSAREGASLKYVCYQPASLYCGIRINQQLQKRVQCIIINSQLAKLLVVIVVW